MPRTTAGAVQGILGGTSDTSNWDGMTDLTPFIETASAIVDQVVQLAIGKATINGGVNLSPAIQELIERWLSAHFYCVLDPLYQSKSTSGASGSFQRQGTDGAFETTDYGRQACAIDYSGMLRALSRRQVAGGFWAGVDMGGENLEPPTGTTGVFGG